MRGAGEEKEVISSETQVITREPQVITSDRWAIPSRSLKPTLSPVVRSSAETVWNTN